MSTQLTTKDSAQTIAALLERQKPELVKSLGSQVPVDFFVRAALTAMRKNPLLFQCTQQSLMQCMMDLAQIRLTPDSITGEAYLIPFRNGSNYECQLMIGYQGYLKMMRRSSNVTNVYAAAVFDADQFNISFGSDRHMKHVPCIRGPRGAMIGAVAYVAHENNGVPGEDFVWVDADYIERVKKSARGSNSPSSPWQQWPEAMWAKTALKQLAKTADLSPDVRETVSRAADLESAIDVPSVVTPEPQPSTLTQPEPPAPKKRSRTKREEPAEEPSLEPEQGSDEGPDDPTPPEEQDNGLFS